MKKILLELELTNICNARCIMCPVIDMKRKKGFMTRETFEMIMKKGIDYGVERIRFCGLGEPLLHKDFSQFLSDVKKHNHCTTELTTNGSLLRKEMVPWLIKHDLDFLSVSFPSLTKENYERIMKGLVFEKVLDRVLFAIDELKKVSATHITITSVVTGINYEEKEQIKHFWAQKGIDSILLHTAHNRGGHLNDVGSLNDIGSLNRYSQVKYVSGPGDQKTLCPWPLNQFFIGWDGSIFLCCCDMEGEYRVGNIHKDDFSEMEKIQESISIGQPVLCKQCSYQRAKTIL